MLPVVSHEVKTGRWPHVTVCLIGLNLIVFAFEATIGVRFVPFLQEWGLVPARVNAEITSHNLVTLGTSHVPARERRPPADEHVVPVRVR